MKMTGISDLYKINKNRKEVCTTFFQKFSSKLFTNAKKYGII